METAAHVNDVYQPRNLRVSDYFKLARDHFEELEMLYPPLRPVGLWAGSELLEPTARRG